MTDRRSPAWRLIFLIAGALALSALVLAAACGDDDDGGDGDEPTATMDNGGNGDGDGNGEDPTDAPDGDGNGDGNGDAGDDFLGDLENFANDFEDATGVVTYTFTSDDDSGSWTIYQDGTSSRVDYQFDGGGFITINTPEATYTCTVDAGDGICFGGDTPGVGVNPLGGLFSGFGSSAAIFTYINAFNDVDIDPSSEEIAGVNANCYTVSGDLVDDEGTIKWCWSDGGLLLLADYDLSTSGAFEMRATEFSESVPGGSFDPPYEVQNLGQ